MNKTFGFILIFLGVFILGGYYFGILGIATMLVCVGLLTILVGD